MNPQLEEVKQELEKATCVVQKLAAPLTEEVWARRPGEGRWSVAECVMHLNITSQAFLPRLREAIEDGRARNVRGEGPFKLDFGGWMLTKLLEPPYRLKVKTAPSFSPVAAEPKEKVLGEFEDLQQQVLSCIREAHGLAIDKLKIPSPFAKNMKYSVYSTFRIIPAHQRRHIWQAEQVILQMKG
jgi:hypothetical protein